MVSENKILGLIEDVLKEQQIFIVSLDISQSNKIRLLIDNLTGIKIDDCVKISRTIETGLDRESEDFELEVSSPGLDAPFKVPEQYRKNLGHPVEVFLKDGHRHEGILLSSDKTGFCIEIEKKIKPDGKKKKVIIKDTVDFVYDEVNKVKAVIKF